MFWSSTAAKRSLDIDAPDGSLNAFPSAVMIFAVFAEDPLAAMEGCVIVEAFGPLHAHTSLHGPVGPVICMSVPTSR